MTGAVIDSFASAGGLVRKNRAATTHSALCALPVDGGNERVI